MSDTLRTALMALPKLEGPDQFETWTALLKSYLVCVGMEKYLTVAPSAIPPMPTYSDVKSEGGTSPDPLEDPDIRRTLSARKRAIAEHLESKQVCAILTILSAKYVSVVQGTEFGHEAWAKLETRFGHRTDANLQLLHQRFMAAKYETYKSMDEFLESMNLMVRQLRASKEPLGVSMLLAKLFATIPAEYEPVTQALYNLPREKLSWELAVERLREAAARAGVRSPGKTPGGQALAVGRGDKERSKERGKDRASRPTCSNCRKRGHKAEDCWAPGGGKAGQIPERYKRNKDDAKLATDNAPKHETAALAFATVVETGLVTAGKEWILDSGASKHMTPHKHLFNNYTETTDYAPITVASGHRLDVVGVGSIDVGGVRLDEVRHVPGLAYSLISVQCLTSQGWRITFEGGSATVTHENGKQLCIMTESAHAAIGAAGISNELTHRRMGHASYRALGLEAAACDACEQSKAVRKGFAEQSARTKAAEAGDLLHVDVGEVRIENGDTDKFYLVAVDEATHMVFTYIMARKSEVPAKLRELLRLIRTQTGRRVRAIRSDGGGEFTGAETLAVAAEEGVQLYVTPPYSPEANGTAERPNRTLMEGTRAMVLEAGAPHDLWSHALSAKTHIYNRTPTRLLGNKTPYEAFTGKEPDISHLRVWGCKAVVPLPTERQGSKLDARSETGTFVGYASMGYLIKIGDRIVYHRAPHFYEHVRGPHCTARDDDRPACENAATPSTAKDATTTRRSTRLATRALAAQQMPPVPMTYEAATTGTDAKDWARAMSVELAAHSSNGTWELTDLPAGCRAIGCRWVYAIKGGHDAPVLFKARLVAQGFSQRPGHDYDETFAPTPSSSSTRLILAIAAQEGLRLRQADFTTAYLNSHLHEELYMRAPPGLDCDGQVLRLRRGLYGLKQAGRLWAATLAKAMEDLDLYPTITEPCLYVGRGCLVLVYVDDLLIACKDEEQAINLIKDLGTQFKIKDLGTPTSFVGMRISTEGGAITITQPVHIMSAITAGRLDGSRAADTPLAAGMILRTRTTEPESPGPFATLLGKIGYVAGHTRPDIAFAYGALGRYTKDPSTTHWEAAKRVTRYLAGTSDHGLHFVPRKGGLLLEAFADADWAGDVDSRLSTGGIVITINGTAVAWQSKKQQYVALSTAEAEYITMAAAVRETLGVLNLLKEIGREYAKSVTVHEDNNACIAIAKGDGNHQRIKHLDIKTRFVQQHVKSGRIVIEYIDTNKQPADILTKPLDSVKTKTLRALLGVRPTKGGVVQPAVAR